jgi:cellobiose-specific phosphotransferase system component IIB
MVSKNFNNPVTKQTIKKPGDKYDSTGKVISKSQTQIRRELKQLRKMLLQPQTESAKTWIENLIEEKESTLID